MDVTSLGFLLFIAFTVIIYFAVPEKYKQYVLILVSFIFVSSYDVRGVLFLLGIAFIIWVSGLKMEKIEDCTDSKTDIKKAKKQILIIALIFVCASLVLLKYLLPAIRIKFLPQFDFSLVMPIGISYFTLQAVSYLVDVYWKRIKAEKDYFKVLLFVSYFPYIVQGPFVRYGSMSHEFFEKKHSFNLHRIKHGVQLMMWGYFKVMVVAALLEKIVNGLFFSGNTAYGLVALSGLVIFGIELYSNFSGGIDIVRGVSECLSIEIPQNFRQPFFSRSLGEFWRRWHITLGEWMKDYMFYPITMSHGISKLKKQLKKHIPKKIANRVPIALANIVVFLIVGIWHGSGSNYAIWGLYNGIILAISEMLADVFKNMKKRLSINENSISWISFTLVRTFIITTIGWCTDCAITAEGSFNIIINMLLIHKTNLSLLNLYLDRYNFAYILIGILIILGVDIAHEKGISIRNNLDHKPFMVQAMLWIILLQMIICLAPIDSTGGLIYANI